MAKERIAKGSDNSAGFTLVEIIVSVVILGLGLTSLIGIQTNYIDSYLREDNLTRAAMFSQYILSMIEIEPDPPDSGKTSGRLESYLSEIGYFDGDFKKDEAVNLDGWEYTLEVQSVDVLVLTDAMKRVELTIRWSEFDLDSFNVIYYVNTPPET